jgi:DNA-binding transcriptional LysR family regulator
VHGAVLQPCKTARSLAGHGCTRARSRCYALGAELIVTKLGTARWLAAGAPDLVKELRGLEAWNSAPWITWDRDLSSLGPARWLARHAPKAESVLRTSHFSSQLLAAASGLGLVFAPEPYLPVRQLQVLRVSEPLRASARHWPSDDLWLVSQRALHDVPRVHAVWEFLASELRERMKISGAHVQRSLSNKRNLGEMPRSTP